MANYQLDPRTIKTRDSGPKAEGGQGTVVIGTIIPPEELITWIPELLLSEFLNANYAIKKLHWDREDIEESVKFFKVPSTFPRGTLLF